MALFLPTVAAAQGLSGTKNNANLGKTNKTTVSYYQGEFELKGMKLGATYNEIFKEERKVLLGFPVLSAFNPSEFHGYILDKNPIPKQEHHTYYTCSSTIGDEFLSKRNSHLEKLRQEVESSIAHSTALLNAKAISVRDYTASINRYRFEMIEIEKNIQFSELIGSNGMLGSCEEKLIGNKVIEANLAFENGDMLLNSISLKFSSKDFESVLNVLIQKYGEPTFKNFKIRKIEQRDILDKIMITSWENESGDQIFLSNSSDGHPAPGVSLLTLKSKKYMALDKPLPKPASRKNDEL